MEGGIDRRRGRRGHEAALARLRGTARLLARRRRWPRSRLDPGQHRIDLFFPRHRLRRQRRRSRRLRDHARRWRRIGHSARVGAAVGRLLVGDDPADGGENLLHRGLLTLCRLRHLPRPPPGPPAARAHPLESTGIKSIKPGLRKASSMAWRRSNANDDALPKCRAVMAGTRRSAGPAMTTEKAVSARYRPSGMRTPPQASRTW